MDLSHYVRFLSHLPVFEGLGAEEIAEADDQADLIKLMGYTSGGVPTGG